MVISSTQSTATPLYQDMLEKVFVNKPARFPQSAIEKNRPYANQR